MLLCSMQNVLKETKQTENQLVAFVIEFTRVPIVSDRHCKLCKSCMMYHVRDIHAHV